MHSIKKKGLGNRALFCFAADRAAALLRKLTIVRGSASQTNTRGSIMSTGVPIKRVGALA